MKVIAILVTIFASAAVFAAPEGCGTVSINKVLGGPKHGSLIQVSDSSCGGRGGWLCLDPDAQVMSKAVSDRLFSIVLASYMAGKKVQVEVDPAVSTSACVGGYPLVHDLRTE